jgi:hypothetical protein
VNPTYNGWRRARRRHLLQLAFARLLHVAAVTVLAVGVWIAIGIADNLNR